MSDYFNPSPYSQTECSICRPLINSYSTQPNISCPNQIQNPVSTAILKCHDSPSPTKIQSRSNLRAIYFRITCRELFSSEIKLDSRSNKSLDRPFVRTLFRSVLRRDEIRRSIFIPKNILAQPDYVFWAKPNPTHLSH